MPLEIVQSDITKIKADAIVNSANSRLKRGRGVCGAIFKASGYNGRIKMSKDCKKLAPIKSGYAVATIAYGKLSCNFIIHVVPPKYVDGTKNEEEILRRTYLNALRTAIVYGCKSVVFPVLASGNYKYPYEEALEIGKSEIEKFLKEYPELDVKLCIYNPMFGDEEQ